MNFTSGIDPPALIEYACKFKEKSRAGIIEVELLSCEAESLTWRAGDKQINLW